MSRSNLRLDTSSRSPLGPPLSPLDQLLKQSRKESLLLSRSASGRHITGVGVAKDVNSGERFSPARGGGVVGGLGGRGREPRVGGGGGRRVEEAPSTMVDKGKGRALQQGDGGWDNSSRRGADVEEDQYADAAGGGGGFEQSTQFSPLRNHGFHGAADSMSTIASDVVGGSPFANNFGLLDVGDVSPVVPEFGASRAEAIQRNQQQKSRTQERQMLLSDPRGYGQPEDETESLAGDRSTWQTDPDNRQSLGVNGYGIPGGRGMTRESALSAMTMESTDGDPFHYTVYENLPSPTKPNFISDPTIPLPPPPSQPLPPPPNTQPQYSRRPPEPLSPSYGINPIVRIGPPSPDFLPDPHDSTLWGGDDHLASPTSPSSSNGFLSSSAPRTPETSPSSAGSYTTSSTGGRTRSQTLAKNFSRPILNGPNGAGSNDWIQRSDSIDSVDNRSLDHSSQGAHSMSSSWEGRVELESRYQQDSKAKVAAAARGDGWTPVDRGLDSPAPFSGYGPVKQDLRPPTAHMQRSSSEPGSSTQLGPRTSYDERGMESPGYRIDSYYAAAAGPSSMSDYPPSPNPRDIPPQPYNEVPRPRTADSNSKVGHNVLLKKSPNPAPTREVEHKHRWNPFRSKSQNNLAKSREVDLTSNSRPSPAISPHQTSQNGTSEERLRQQREDEAMRRQHLLPLQREQPSYRPGAGKSVVASYVDGSQGAPRPPGWEAQEVEQLEENPIPMPRSMQRSASDFGPSSGPQRLPDPQQQPPSPSPHGRANSLYSNYSFYSFSGEETRSAPGTRQPSPSASPKDVKFAQGTNQTPATGTMGKAKANFKAGRGGDLPSGDPVTPEDFLQLGIKFHEDGELERSAWYLEMSAKKDADLTILATQKGCQMQPELGFRYLQSAAETVVLDLDKVVAGTRELSMEETGAKAAKNELMLALYEIGTSFRFGWGVVKDKKMAVSYFTLAADLGDPDAQSDLAFCYANGKGCKKNMKQAAKYYRLATAQGGESFGLSWIYKPKYMDD
ncbi:uncharacterized protein P7C70_g3613, partial [Phenoliferia sp. Uapishka_3]